MRSGGRFDFGRARRVRVDVLVARELADLVHDLVGVLAQREVVVRPVVVAAGSSGSPNGSRPAGTPAASSCRSAAPRRCRSGRPGRSARPSATRAAPHRCGRGACSRRAFGCLRDRCRTHRPPAARPSPTSSARSLALPPSRRIGIWPTPRKNQAVFGLSKYSALATNVTRRRTTSGRKIESRNERWLAGEDRPAPSRGTCSLPFHVDPVPGPQQRCQRSFDDPIEHARPSPVRERLRPV